jgi:hypothetical protein
MLGHLMIGLNPEEFDRPGGHFRRGREELGRHDYLHAGLQAVPHRLELR